MPRIDLCRDGTAVSLLHEEGVWFVLTHEEREVSRFQTDLSEVQAVLQGRFALQFTDGAGNGVSIAGMGGGLRIRLESDGIAPKSCRIGREDVEKISKSLNDGV